MKRYAIFGYYGQGNAGDEAILSALLQGVRNSSPNCSICVYSANPDQTQQLHGVTAHQPINLSILHACKRFFRAGRNKYAKSLIDFFRADVIVIGGGGLFFDSRETNIWMRFYLNLIKKSKTLRKTVAIVGVSMGPLHRPDSGRLIAEAFPKADLICVRDSASRQLLLDIGLSSTQIEVIPDLVFNLHPAKEERVLDILSRENCKYGARKAIALTPCCYNQRNPGWIEQYVNFCNSAVESLDVNLWLVPMQRNASLDDLRAIQDIAALLNPHAKARTTIFSGLYNPSEMQGILGKADYVFAERLHGAIMALSTGTPCVAISYMPKVAGVMIEAGLGSQLIFMSDFLSGQFLHGTLQDIEQTLNTGERFNCSDVCAKAQAVFPKLHALAN